MANKVHPQPVSGPRTSNLCDCDQSFEVHPPGYHALSCAIWGPRFDLPDEYEFAFTNSLGSLSGSLQLASGSTVAP